MKSSGPVPAQASPAPAALTAPAIVRGLRRDLVDAADAKVLQVAALVDTMSERGAADSLIAPLRARLAQLRPRRPLQFTRLLYLPLDPMIVAPWRPDTIGVPRGALAPLASLVRDGLGRDLAGVEAMLAGRDQCDAAAVARAGARLWPIAARILVSAAGGPPIGNARTGSEQRRRATDREPRVAGAKPGAGLRCPPGWAATGLRDDMFALLARTVGGMLSLAADIEALADAVAGGALSPEQAADRVARLLGAAETAGVRELCAAILLHRLPALPAVPAALARGASLGNSVGRLLNTVLDQVERQAGGVAVAGLSIGNAARELQRRAEMLAALEALAVGPGQDARLIARLQLLRHAAEADCRARLDAAVNTQFVTLLSNPGEEAASMLLLEGAARDLRRLEQVARALIGSAGAVMDRARAAARDSPTIALVDRVRLTEILVGSDAAYALLTAPGPARTTSPAGPPAGVSRPSATSRA